MAHLEITSEEMYIEIQYTTGKLLPDNQRVIDLIKHLRNLHALVTLASLSLTESPAGSKSFDYTYTTGGGRTWTQVLRTSAQEAEMNWTVENFWKRSEDDYQNKVRLEIIGLIAENGVTDITVTW